MSWQHVTKNQIRQNLCDLLRRQILLQRQRFFYKNSPVHTKPFVVGMFRSNVLLQLVAQPVHTEWSASMTCCCKLLPDLHTQSDLLPRLVAATCSSTCTHRVICHQDLLLQLVTRHVHTECSIIVTCCCNLSPDMYTQSVLSPWLVAATCHPTCTHRVFYHHDLLLQLVPRPVHTEWSVTKTCCCNLSPDMYTQCVLSLWLVAATCHLMCSDLYRSKLCSR